MCEPIGIITFTMIFYFLLQLTLVIISLIATVGISMMVFEELDKFAGEEVEEKDASIARFIINMTLKVMSWFAVLAVFSYSLSLFLN